MTAGGRITDEVETFKRVGDLRNAVRIVRSRRPERLRWRTAVASMTQEAGQRRGSSRVFIEEPIREIVLDIDDRILRRETVLDARRVGVDLDRGEVLPQHTRWDLKRTAYLVGVDHDAIARYTALPLDFDQPIDTGAVVLVSRSLAHYFAERAEKLSAAQNTAPAYSRQQLIADRVQLEREQARRWAALSRALSQGSR